MSIFSRWRSWRYRRNGIKSMPDNIVRRDDGTLWTTARVSLVEAAEGLLTGTGAWIFNRLIRLPDGTWARVIEERWKIYSTEGWECLVVDGKILRGREELER